MKKFPLAVFAFFAALLVPTAAVAQTDCVPWTEVIEHPAQGEEFIEVIDAEAWTETIDHPAVYEDVEHEAVYEVKYEYRKEVRGEVWQRDNGKHTWHKTGKTFDWTPWTPASIKWRGADFTETGPHHGIVREWTEGNGNKKWRWVSTEYRYVQTGETQQGQLLKEAWTESVLVTEAWTETIEHEATYKTVENPDYVPAWTETIEHLDCPEPTPSPEPTPDPEPSPSPSAPAPDDDELDCPEGKVPGWLDEDGDPTSCVDDDPTPWPDPIPDHTPKIDPLPDDPTPDLPELPETGPQDTRTALGAALLLLIAGGWILGMRKLALRGRV